MTDGPPRLSLGHCVKCGGGQKLVGPLHLEKGGPIFCLPCGTEWHAEQARSRNWREMQKRFMDMVFGGTAYAGPHELTLDLIEEAVRLTHPDRHPERAEQATRVTAELLALKPFVLPKPPPPPSNTSATVTPWDLQTSVTPTRESATRSRLEELKKSVSPCEICRHTVPSYYCDACKDHYETQQRARREGDNKKREMDNKKQRERRAWRRQQRPPGRCAVCGTAFEGKRKDAQYCSAACRQRAHRSCHGQPDMKHER